MKSLGLLEPTADLPSLHRRVKALAEPRPGIYRMLDGSGRVLYVGKAKRVRARLLSYFRAPPADKAARILHAAADISWEYTPSEFAAHLTELREIRKWRPPYNVQMNRHRQAVFVSVSADPAPRLTSTTRPTSPAAFHYGPLASPARTREAIRVLTDLLGLRDCTQQMPMVFAEQGDLFGQARQAGCARHELGLCAGPCAGLVTYAGYRERVDRAVSFLEGRSIAPIDRVVVEMTRASGEGQFERAARWRERFEALEWLLAATTRARAAVALLSFVYREPGAHGDDRAYLIRRGVVRATYPWPATPIEQEAFRAVVTRELATPEPAGPLATDCIEEMLLVMSWFRRHPEALRRTTPLAEWM
jgi:excinuclease ABC subunit C